MSIDHLTEEQLQSYVEGQSMPGMAEIEKHLRSCKRCQKQVNAYKTVRSGMVQEPPDASFSDGFEDSLMTRILRPEAGRFQSRDYLVAAFAVVTVMTLLCYLFLYGRMRALIVDSCAESWSLLKGLALDILCFGGNNGSCLMIPVAALIMIIGFKILDKIYVRPRIKPTQ